jgi:hypothetical protein
MKQPNPSAPQPALSHTPSLLLLLTLLILLLPALGCRLVDQAFQSQPSPTNTVQMLPTATQPAPTPTRTAPSTATLRPTATKAQLTPTRTPRQGSGAIDYLYQESFNESTGAWMNGDQTSEYGDFNATREQNALLWEFKSKGQNWVHSEWLNDTVLPAGFFTQVVTFQVRDGAEGLGVGLIVRLQDKDNYYLFEVYNNQQFGVYALENGEWKEIATGTAPALRQNDWNSLSLVGGDGDYDFYLNDTLLTLVSDSRFSDGLAGLLVEVPEDATDVAVLFDQIDIGCSRPSCTP